jgi:hypothetical protein
MPAALHHFFRKKKIHRNLGIIKEPPFLKLPLAWYTTELPLFEVYNKSLYLS